MTDTIPAELKAQRIAGRNVAATVDGQAIFEVVASGHNDTERMRRLVACWNACQGLSTEALEAGALREFPQADAAVDGLFCSCGKRDCPDTAEYRKYSRAWNEAPDKLGGK